MSQYQLKPGYAEKLQDAMSEFDAESFEAMLRSGKSIIWNDHYRFRIILWMMKRFAMNNPYDLRRMHFDRQNGVRNFAGVYQCPRYNSQPNVMVNEVLEKTFNPQLDEDQSRWLTLMDAFDTEQFEAQMKDLRSRKRIMNAIYDRGNVILYVMKTNNYRDPSYIQYMDLVTCFGDFRSSLAHQDTIKKVIHDKLHPNVLTIDPGDVTDGDELVKMYMSRLDVSKFEEWLSASRSEEQLDDNTKFSRKWDDEQRFRLILWIMITNKLETVFDINIKHFVTQRFGGLRASYRDYDCTHSKMIIEVLRNKGIVFEEDWLTQAEKTQQRNEYLESVTKYGVPVERFVGYHGAKLVIDHVPTLVANGLQPVSVSKDDKIGCCYIVRDSTTKDVIYVGSSLEFHQRVKNHIRNCLMPRTKEHFQKPLYVFIRNTYKNFDKLEFVPVAIVPVGFEKLLEAEFYRHLEHHHTLRNGVVPTINSIDDIGYIYVFKEITTNTVFYVGSTNNFYMRYRLHSSSCYNPNAGHESNKLAYLKIRSMDPSRTSWPDDLIRMEPIEAGVPVWLLKEREQHYIDLYKVDNDTACLNPVNAVTSIDEKKEKRAAYKKIYVTCCVCGMRIGKGYLTSHQRERHSPNFEAIEVSMGRFKHKNIRVTDTHTGDIEMCNSLDHAAITVGVSGPTVKKYIALNKLCANRYLIEALTL